MQQLDKVLENMDKLDSDLKKRFACAHCGKTWVEIVGVFAGNIEGQEDTYFQVGEESAACQSCRFRQRSCPTCGSKDAYEINFPTNQAQDSPLSFNRIRIVSKT